MADIKTQKTQLKIESPTSPAEYVLCGGVKSISGFRSGEAVEIDVTDFDSDAMEFLMGLPDNGSFTVNLNYAPSSAQQEQLEEAREDQTALGFQLVLAGAAATFTFDAFVKQFALDLEANSSVQGSVTLRVTGAITKT